MATMTSLSTRRVCAQGLELANCGPPRRRAVGNGGKQMSMCRGPRIQGLGQSNECRHLGSELKFCSNGQARIAGFSQFVANAGAEKVGFGDGGGDIGGNAGGRGGGGDSGDDLRGNSGDDSSQGFGSTLWIWYNGMLENHPLIAKSLTSALLNAIADYFCQVFVEKLDKVDWKRFWSFVAIGLFLSGPGLHYWYGALPKIITVPGLGGVLLRIGLDQVIFTPLGMLSFFIVLLTLENRQDQIQRKLEKDWWPTVVANWKVWIPFQIVNFGMVPPQLQVPAAGLLGMVWSVFISYKGHT
ncbi:hypothetical protein Mapa_018515 [Marchantia paleacea]|nr:hypothetical protein Mapa_018515 [Marchantia paleacea]